MNGLPYYKAYPRDFFDGTAGMDFEVKAAYRLVLDLIYMHGGRLVDDSRFIAGQFGCSVKKWNGLRSAILATGKIVVENGYLGNLRADKELDSLKSFQTKQRENGSQPKKNNGLTKATAEPKANHTDTDTDTDTVSKDTAADAPIDPAKAAFDAGIALLSRAGKSPATARTLIGKWIKAHKAEAVIVALGRAQREGAVDPVAFIEGIFRAAPKTRGGERRQLPDGRWQSYDSFNGWVTEHV